MTQGRSSTFAARRPGPAPPSISRAAHLVALTVLCVLALTATANANHPTPFATALPVPPTLSAPDIALTAQQAPVQIFSGAPTQMWTYNGSFPGPTIRRPTGQTTRVTLFNNLPVAAGSITLHNHGNHSASAFDGQPDSFLVPTGGFRTYYYTGLENGGNERGTMQWYHDHRLDVTARNVWMGLAGLYILDDPADPPTLPSGPFDVPLALSDRSFDANNQISYQFQTNGVTGDHILVNGGPQPYVDVGDRKYRFRILNASNFRNYEIELSNGASMTQIGTESGLLPAPVTRQRILLSPAERADVVVDFAGMLGQNVVLKNADANGPPLSDLVQFKVNQDVTDTSSVPSTLRAVDDLGTPTVTRTFDFGRNGGQWTINDLPFDPNRVDASPVLGTTERWILRNSGGWNHTVHIHDVDQQLISRNGGAPPPFETTKESWYIGGGQEVEVKIRFTDHVGRYVFHCHMLEHEDDEMMGQFEVVPAPSPPATGYVRPKGATPVLVSLVPAHQEATNPNRQHEGSLGHPAQSPPQQASSSLTVGTPDASGTAANFIGSARFDVCPVSGCAAPDVRIEANLADVRCRPGVTTCGAPNAAGGEDYTGELQGRSMLRMTDRYSGNSLDEAATVVDASLEYGIPCAATASTSVGASCAALTTLNALYAGAAVSSKRAVVEVGRLEVRDGGVDGLAWTEPNDVFAVQGIFLP